MDPIIQPSKTINFIQLIFNPGMTIVCWYSAIYFFRRESIQFKDAFWLPFKLGLPFAISELNKTLNAKGKLLIGFGYISLVAWLINL
jgi:hypothetical protein